MIITQQKKWDEVLDILKDAKSVFLVGCADCATTCKVGGEPEILQAKAKFEAAGKTVTGWMVSDVPCISAVVKKDFAKHRPEVKSANAVVTFACGECVQSVKENARLDVPVYPATNTLFYGCIGADNNFYEHCTMCGECILPVTGGICPITRCAKGILNGPCGGMEKGKCEVDRTQDCTWVLIYNELKKQGKLEQFKEFRAPKDYSLMNHPRKRLVSAVVKE
ncbi:MAG: methylenetetrahydrofolate reductase C-terminal domain-containing protein [Candidatus Omnitrophica bacterium]|nr:methylenetetrahydrofolate reductase C-terminal domain-containing protein [Candidatus Omnitrophota bacterium]